MMTSLAHILLVLSCWISASLQAEVNETCSQPNSEAVQCYTLTFTRSVYEGHDVLIQPAAAKKQFLLTLYSNTPQTDQLKGYDVNIKAPCNFSTISVEQRASSPPPNCDTTVSVCNSSEYVMFIEAGSKSNIFHSQIQIPKPISPFLLTVKPRFDEDENALHNSLGSSGGFTPTSLSSVSKSQATMCELTLEKDPQVVQTIAFVIAIALLLLIAALLAKFYILLWPRLRPAKKGYYDLSSSGDRMEMRSQSAHSSAGGQDMMKTNNENAANEKQSLK